MSFLPCVASGVGSSFVIASVRVSPLCASDPGVRPAVELRTPRESVTTGVGSSLPGPVVPGEDEDPLALVAGPGVSGGYNLPLRIEPETGKVPKHGTKCPQAAGWAVSHAHLAGFHVAMGTGAEQSTDILQNHD